MAGVKAIEALRAAALLEGVAEADLVEAAGIVRRISLARGQRLWSEGDEARDVFVLAEGAILISRTGPGGEELIIKIYVEGDVLGKIDAFAEGRRLSDAVAASPVTCFALPAEALQELAGRNPVVGRRLLRELSETSRAQLEATTDIAFRDIKARVARKLLDLADSHGLEAGKGGRIDIPLDLTQGHLAAMVAASRANVNRALAVLMAEGSVDHRRGRFSVLRRGKLEAAM